MNRSERAAKLRGIYAIINADAPTALVTARAALDGGVRVLQYRAKRGIVAERVRAMCGLAHEHNALLILNDDWRAAVEFDCDGVHLGPDDVAFEDLPSVRAFLDQRVIGLSCGTLAEAHSIAAHDLDYLGVGAVFATASKSDAGEPIGIAGLRPIAEATPFPVAAIGGIDHTNLAAVRACGVAMAAVISAIADALDPRAATRELVAAWEQL